MMAVTVNHIVVVARLDEFAAGSRLTVVYQRQRVPIKREAVNRCQPLWSKQFMHGRVKSRVVVHIAPSDPHIECLEEAKDPSAGNIACVEHCGDLLVL